jgi:hypothetical protein
LFVSALVLPVIVFPLILALSARSHDGSKVHGLGAGFRGRDDLMVFLARTNPVMFLMFGLLTRRSNDDRYQELLRAGPYGLGQRGILIALILILTP